MPTSAQRLQQEGYSRLTALVIANAGVENKEQAEEFLHSETVHNPAKIRNIEKVSEIIWDHIYRKEKICVFGDYDCDGVTGAAILYLMLKRLGADVEGLAYPYCRRCRSIYSMCIYYCFGHRP